MTVHPLTHHEILGLIEPFTRRGRHPDLASSNRIERRVVFRPIDHPGVEDDAPLLREILLLDSPEPERYELTRVLRLPCGLEARLQAEGPKPGELLARLEAVERARQFCCGPGYRIAQNYRLEPGASELLLTSATLQLPDLTLLLKAPAVGGAPAELELTAPSGGRLDLPDDLLAVLGWNWGLLYRTRDGWRSALKLRGREPQRSRLAERQLGRAAEHLQRTLSEPPPCFHERQRAARWKVVLRRALPLLICIALIAGTAALPRLHLAPDSALRMLIFNAPPLLMIIVFSLRELPRLEIPPWPRPARASLWHSE
jgi:hypothetical protein